MRKDQIQLTNPEIYPDEEILKKVLGKSYNAFTKLMKLYEENEMTHEWRFYKDGKAWLCKVQKKKRTIVWMSVWSGHIEAVIYFPKRLLENVFELEISNETQQIIKTTKDVGKSKPCIFEVRNETILEDFEKVMQLKIRSK
jgi:hypothetical protein